MFFTNSAKQKTTRTSAEKPAKKTNSTAENALAHATLYHFKRDVLALVARMNQGVAHSDCEIIKRQTMFIQSQLLHSLSNDPSLPAHLKILLMDYHAKSVRATLGERRGEHLRGTQ